MVETWGPVETTVQLPNIALELLLIPRLSNLKADTNIYASVFFPGSPLVWLDLKGNLKTTIVESWILQTSPYFPEFGGF